MHALSGGGAVSYVGDRGENVGHRAMAQENQENADDAWKLSRAQMASAGNRIGSSTATENEGQTSLWFSTGGGIAGTSGEGAQATTPRQSSGNVEHRRAAAGSAGDLGSTGADQAPALVTSLSNLASNVRTFVFTKGVSVMRGISDVVRSNGAVGEMTPGSQEIAEPVSMGTSFKILPRSQMENVKGETSFNNSPGQRVSVLFGEGVREGVKYAFTGESKIFGVKTDRYTSGHKGAEESESTSRGSWK